jgi:hypothetical protein
VALPGSLVVIRRKAGAVRYVVLQRPGCCRLRITLLDGPLHRTRRRFDLIAVNFNALDQAHLDGQKLGPLIAMNGDEVCYEIYGEATANVIEFMLWRPLSLTR